MVGLRVGGGICVAVVEGANVNVAAVVEVEAAVGVDANNEDVDSKIGLDAATFVSCAMVFTLLMAISTMLAGSSTMGVG